MPRGYLQSALQQFSNDAISDWSGTGAHYGPTSPATRCASTSSDAGAFIVEPTLIHRRMRPHGAKLGASFIGTSFADDDTTATSQEQNAAKAEDPFPGWRNVEGLPKVELTSKNEKFFSPDIAEAAGDGSFKPIFGCKCGDWQPAPTHPVIKFRDTFLGGNPNFTKQLRKLKVHMEDTTNGKVHWDATYDLRRFIAREDLANANQPGGSLALTETIPAEKGSGSQLRFMTFCPPESSPGVQAAPHDYLLKVTALDADEQPIPGFIEEEARYTATPSEPEATGPAAAVPADAPTPMEPMAAPPAAEPVVASARVTQG